MIVSRFSQQNLSFRALTDAQRGQLSQFDTNNPRVHIHVEEQTIGSRTSYIARSNVRIQNEVEPLHKEHVIRLGATAEEAKFEVAKDLSAAGEAFWRKTRITIASLGEFVQKATNSATDVPVQKHNVPFMYKHRRPNVIPKRY